MIADRGISLDLSQFSQEQKEHKSSQPIRGIGVLKHDRKSPEKMPILEGKSSNSWLDHRFYGGCHCRAPHVFRLRSIARSGWANPPFSGTTPKYQVI